MRKFANAISLALVAMLLLAAAGCSTSVAPTNAATSAPPDTTAPQSAEAATSAPAATTEPTPAPMPLPEVKLTYYMLMGAQQPEQDLVFEACNKYIKDKINATVDFIPLEWGNYTDKMKTMVTVNDPFDIAWVASWQPGIISYQAMSENGNLLAIDSLLDQYAPETKAAVPASIWDLVKVNGKTYGVPCYQIMVTMGGLWVKKDLADKYGFDPKTLKKWTDLEPFMQKVKDGEPGVTPIATNENYMQWFGIGYGPQEDKMYKELGSGTRCYIAYDDPKTVLCDTDPVLVASHVAECIVARDWYQKGFVRKDLYTIKDIGAEIKTGNYAVGFGTYKPGWDAEFKTNYGFDVYTVPLDRNAVISNASATTTMLSVSAGTKNPERCLMLLNLFETDANLYNLISSGIENRHYVKLENNNIKPVENSGYNPGMYWSMGNTFIGYFIPGKSPALNDETQKMNTEAIVAIMQDFVPNIDNLKNEIAAMDSLWSEVGQQLWTGTVDGDYTQLYNSYMEKIKKVGIEKVKAEMQKQVDEYWASHK